MIPIFTHQISYHRWMVLDVVDGVNYNNMTTSETIRPFYI